MIDKVYDLCGCCHGNGYNTHIDWNSAAKVAYNETCKDCKGTGKGSLIQIIERDIRLEPNSP